MDGADESFNEKAALDGPSILCYEEHITELLVTVARLHSKVEHLQQQKAREEDDVSDLGTEYTASLPRCPLPFLSSAVTLPSSVCAEEGNADLFIDVEKAITSLENVVSSHRSHMPSAEAELEEYVQVAESMEKSLWEFQGEANEPLAKLDLESQMLSPGSFMNEPRGYEKEIAVYQESNAALQCVLEDREEEMQKSKAAICAYQEERDKLHRKMKELQDALSKMENLPEGNASPVREGEQWEFQNPLASAQNFIRCFQSATPSTHATCHHVLHQVLPPAEAWTKDLDAQILQLQGFIKKLKSFNQLLLTTLQECKNDMEWISMLLSQQESDSAALSLAVQYSECCLEAFEVLFLLSIKEQHPWMENVEEDNTPQTDFRRRADLLQGPALPEPLQGDKESHSPLADVSLGRATGETPAAPSAEVSQADVVSDGTEERPSLQWARSSICKANSRKAPPSGPTPSTSPGPAARSASPSKAPAAEDLGSSHHEKVLAVVDKALKSLQPYDTEGCISEQSFPDPKGVEGDERKMLQEYVKLLKTEQASVKLPAHQPLTGADSAAARMNAGIGAKVAEVQRTLQNTHSAEAVKPRMEKVHLLQELQTIKEALSDLNITLHLTEKEKQVLELHTYTYRAQEAICLLIIQILQGEVDGSWELHCDSSSSSSSSSGDSCSGDYASICPSRQATSGLSQAAGGKLPSVHSGTQMLELLDTLARNKELKTCIQTLLSNLEERSQDSRAQERQQMELVQDFFKAHSALVLAYQNARRKQEAQVHQLETQMDSMDQRQAGQVQSLVKIIEKLEGRVDNQAPHVG